MIEEEKKPLIEQKDLPRQEEQQNEKFIPMYIIKGSFFRPPYQARPKPVFKSDAKAHLI